MENSKIFSLIKRLDKAQLRKFQDYVQSPFFNKHAQISSLADTLINAARKGSDRIDTAQLYQKLYNSTQIDNKQLHYLSTRLQNLLNDFLAYETYDKLTLRKYNYSIQQLHQLNAEAAEKSLTKKYRSERLKYPEITAERIYEDYLLHKTLDKIYLDKNIRIYDDNLQRQNDALDQYYLIEKLKIICDMLNRNVVIQAVYLPTYAQEIEQLLEQMDFSSGNQPIVQIYYNIYKMLRYEQVEAYQQLIQLSQQYAQRLMPDDLLLMMDYAENYCIRQINSGQSGFYSEFLNIYKFKLKHGLLFIDGFIPESDYKNIVTAGVRTKEYKWTSEFIHSNKSKLRSDVKENAYKYNLAVLYFAQKQYQKALQLLMEISLRDIAYGVGAKTIQLQTYYALQEYEAMRNLIDTFRLYVGRHKTQSDYRKKANLNMLRIVKKIINLKEKSTYIPKHKYNMSKQSITQLFEQLSPVSNAGWVKEIMNEL